MATLSFSPISATVFLILLRVIESITDLPYNTISITFGNTDAHQELGTQHNINPLVGFENVRSCTIADKLIIKGFDEAQFHKHNDDTIRINCHKDQIQLKIDHVWGTFIWKEARFTHRPTTKTKILLTFSTILNPTKEIHKTETEFIEMMYEHRVGMHEGLIIPKPLHYAIDDVKDRERIAVHPANIDSPLLKIQFFDKQSMTDKYKHKKTLKIEESMRLYFLHRSTTAPYTVWRPHIFMGVKPYKEVPEELKEGIWDSDPVERRKEDEGEYMYQFALRLHFTEEQKKEVKKDRSYVYRVLKENLLTYLKGSDIVNMAQKQMIAFDDKGKHLLIGRKIVSGAHDAVYDEYYDENYYEDMSRLLKYAKYLGLN